MTKLIPQVDTLHDAAWYRYRSELHNSGLRRFLICFGQIKTVPTLAFFKCARSFRSNLSQQQFCCIGPVAGEVPHQEDWMTSYPCLLDATCGCSTDKLTTAFHWNLSVLARLIFFLLYFSVRTKHSASACTCDWAWACYGDSYTAVSDLCCD